MSISELTICGAGIFGLTLAWNALKRGVGVTVIDPGGPGHGASGGIVGALQPHTPDPWNTKKQLQLESLLMARDFWPEIEAATGLASGYSQVGRIMPLLTDRELELAHARGKASRNVWGDNAVWEVVDAPALTEWCPPSPTGYYVRDTLSAILHPRLATAALAAAVTERGGRIEKDAPLSPCVIWATGWQGLLDINTDLNKTVGNGVKGQAALLECNAAGQPQIYADGLHIIPHLDGTVAIGSTSERSFEDPTRTDGQVEALVERARHLMPQLAEAPIVASWAGVRPRAFSRAPLLGPWPGRAGHFIANGGFKIGFGMAPKCAELVLDLVLGGADNIPAEFHTDAIDRLTATQS